MQIWHGLDDVLAATSQPGHLLAAGAVLSIGNFDGVHCGHQSVLTRVVSLARELGMAAIAMTFDPHPSQVHRPDQPLELITGLDDRLAVMRETGLDAVLVEPYTHEFASQSPADFVRRYVVEALGARLLVVGQDIRFGAGNVGTIDTLRLLGAQWGFEVEAHEDVGGGELGEHRWSSTVARDLLAQGDVQAVATLLGRPHLVRGTVVHGDARGRELGFPTANLGDIQGMVPAHGVYAGWLLRPGAAQQEASHPGAAHPGARLPAAISIGTNPTFGDVFHRRVEAHVLGRTDLDLYDEQVVVEFVARLRSTVKFSGVEVLIAQIHQDVVQARAVLNQASGA